jgi:hypothetical protein
MEYKLALVLLTAGIELWGAVPLGLGMSLAPMSVGVATVIGATVGVLIAAFAGESVRKFFMRGKDPAAAGGLRKWVFDKGHWVIGLLGPILLGATVTAALAAGMGLQRRKWLPLVLVSVVFWTVLLVMAGGSLLTTVKS